MELSEAKSLLERLLGEEMRIHKLDRSAEKGLCLYLRKTGRKHQPALNGTGGRSFRRMGLSLLVRGGRQGAAAEKHAFRIYRLIEEAEAAQGRFWQMVYDAPVALGTDERGVYEYSIDFDLYYEKE